MDIPDFSLTRVILVAVIAVGTFIAMQVVGRVLRRSMGTGEVIPATSIFVNVARGIIAVLGALAILAVFDISITPILTALGVGGLAVALALQDTLSNLFAGLQIVATKQIRPGDYLLLDTGQEGTVADIAWRTTTLRTAADSLVIVPNSVLGQAIVTNFQLPMASMSAAVEFGVPYQSDLARIEAVVADVIAQVAPPAEGQAPIVRFKALAESQIVCSAILNVPAYSDQVPIKSAFIKALHARFAEEGLAFATPRREVRSVRE